MERPFRRVRLLSLILLSAVVASGARAAAIERVRAPTPVWKKVDDAFQVEPSSRRSAPAKSLT